MSADESVLARWSRRKLEAEREAVEPVPEAETDASQVPAAVAAEAEAPPLTDADMPDVETLTEDSDFSPFMSPGVSEELRNLALRKLFRAPSFNIRDGLDEYDDDFTSFAKLGDVVTSDMKHRIEMEQQKLREKLAQEAEQGEIEDVAEADVEDPGEEDFDDEVEAVEMTASAVPAERNEHG